MTESYFRLFIAVLLFTISTVGTNALVRSDIVLKYATYILLLLGFSTAAAMLVLSISNL